MASRIQARQYYRFCDRNDDGSINESSCYTPFWYTQTGVIVKWSLFLGLVAFILLYLLLGYMHAQRRMRKGLRPLAYHRFLVPRRQLARVDPNYQYPQAQNVEARPYFHNQQYFGMTNLPPPVYDPNSARPPMYPGPPAEGTKVDPSQQPQQAGVDYAPPPGPPPANSLQPQGTGSNNPFRG